MRNQSGASEDHRLYDEDSCRRKKSRNDDGGGNWQRRMDGGYSEKSSDAMRWVILVATQKACGVWIETDLGYSESRAARDMVTWS